MTDEELDRLERGAWRAKAIWPEDPHAPVKLALITEVRRLRTELARSRSQALEEAAQTECLLCRTGSELRYAEGSPLPHHMVKGRFRQCAARLIHMLNRPPAAARQ